MWREVWCSRKQSKVILAPLYLSRLVAWAPKQIVIGRGNLILSRVVAASFWGDMQTGYYRGIVDNVNLTEVTPTS